MGYPRFQRARSHKFIRRTAGDLALTVASNWTDVNTSLDMALDAQTGDVIEYGINGYTDATTGSGALDVVTVVAGAPITSFASGVGVTTAPPPYGIQGWQFVASRNDQMTGSIMLTLTVGDISASGLVTLRLRYNMGVATKTLYASTNNPLQVYAKNLGPVDPN